MSTNDFSAALFGKARRSVLALFFSHPEESFYLREVARRAEIGLGAAQRELQRLTNAGILLRQARGRQVYYQADRQCPVFAELQALFVKTAGVAQVAHDALRGLADRIRVAFLYGSWARGMARAGSDVDVLVVGAVTFGEVVEALAATQQWLGREVNPTVYPPAEFRRKLAQGHHFLTAILAEPKVFLLGGDHELERLAEGRLADGTPEQPARSRRSLKRG